MRAYASRCSVLVRALCRWLGLHRRRWALTRGSLTGRHSAAGRGWRARRAHGALDQRLRVAPQPRSDNAARYIRACICANCMRHWSEGTTHAGVDVDTADAPGGVEAEDSSVLASARKEQDEYIKEQNAAALQQVQAAPATHPPTNPHTHPQLQLGSQMRAHAHVRAHSQAKGIVSMAKETNAKFGGTFSDGVGSNTWAGTPVCLHACVVCLYVSVSLCLIVSALPATPWLALHSANALCSCTLRH